MEGISFPCFRSELYDFLQVLIRILGKSWRKIVFYPQFPSQFYEQTQKLAITDGLTKLYNHRFFQEKLAQEFAHCEKNQRPLSLLMIDIDHFKTYNDTHGHPRGDLVLREIAQILGKSVRTSDIIARYGGEEFVIILPDTPKTGAVLLAERILTKVRNHKFSGKSETENVRLTVSLGVASYPREAVRAEDLIEKADQKLYQAKNEGRNKICFDNLDCSSPILK